MLKSRLLAGLTAAALLALMPCAAFAQQGADPFARDRNLSVRERPKPELDPIGVRVGGFRLDPEVEVGYAWTDNVYASETNEESDESLVARAAARLSSQWRRHGVEASAAVATRNGREVGAQDGTDVALAAAGRLDLGRSSFLRADVRAAEERESRVDFAPREALAEPVEVRSAAAGVTAGLVLNRLRTIARIEQADFEFEDARTRDGGLLLQRDRSRSTTAAELRVEYALSPAAAAFVSAGYRKQDYDLEAPEAAFDRDSDGWRGLVGANFDLTRLVRGEIAAGFQSIAYEDPRLAETEGFSASAAADWFVSPVVTIAVNAAREIVESNESAASGISRTLLGARGDWEARRNVIVSAGAAYVDDEYENIDRNDQRWRLNGAVEYQLNRAIALVGAYERFQEESEGAQRGAAFEVNRVTVSLRLRR